jgi:hypothetical protein
MNHREFGFLATLELRFPHEEANKKRTPAKQENSSPHQLLGFALGSTAKLSPIKPLLLLFAEREPG